MRVAECPCQLDIMSFKGFGGQVGYTGQAHSSEGGPSRMKKSKNPVVRAYA